MSRKKHSGANRQQQPSAPVPARQWSQRRVLRWLLVAVATIAVAIGWHSIAARQRAESLYKQGRGLLTTNPVAAERLLEEAVSVAGGDFPAAQVCWARALVRTQRPVEALGCFSLTKRPALADPQDLLGLADDAMQFAVPKLATMALSAIPKDSAARPEAIGRLIGIARQFGQLEQALELADEATQLRPDDFLPWLRTGEIKEQLLDPFGAVTAYEESLKREVPPDQRLAALRSLTRLKITLGEKDAARRCQDEVTSLAATRLPDDRLREASLWRMEGNTEAAWKETLALLEENPQNLTAIELSGTLAMDRSDWPKAESEFRKVIARQPWNKNAHYRLAQALQHLGQANSAAEHFAVNRRLTATSLKILRIRSAPDSGSLDQLRELKAAYDEIGQTQMAESIRRRIESLTEASKN